MTPDETTASPGDLTRRLREWAAGDSAAFEQIYPQILSELKALARGLLRNERDSHTLSCTALVHEAYLRLANQQGPVWQGRSHFFGAAARTMRRVLVDHARARKARKRGNGIVGEDLERVVVAVDPMVDLVELDVALTALAQFDPARALLVELRFFAGLSNEEAAGVLGCSVATVKRDWVVARAWLYREMTGKARD